MDVPGTRATPSSSTVASQGSTAPAASRAPAEVGRCAPAVPFAALLGRRAAVATTKRAGGARDFGGAAGARRNPHASVPAGADRDATAPGGHKQGGRDDATEGGAAGAKDAEVDEPAAGKSRALSDELEALDPAARHAAHLAPPLMSTPIDATAAAATEPLRARSLEELLPALVRRIAWAGDRHKGTVRLELGAGPHAGTTVTVHADGELDRLRTRLDARLRGHGLDVESVT